MTHEFKEVFKSKRADLVLQRDAFNYETENRKISSLESQLDDAVAERNDKKSFYDRYEKMIKQLDDTFEHVNEIMGVEDVPLSPLEPATPVEETKNV